MGLVVTWAKTKPKITASNVLMRIIAKIISIKDKMFLGYHQHDSQELLNMLLDSIHDELKVNISIVYENIDPIVEKFMKLKRRYLQ